MARRFATGLRVAAAVPGTLPSAVGLGVLVARHAPLALDARLVLGVLLVAPLWVALMCAALLARSAARAWAVSAAAAVLVGLAALLAR